MGQLCCTDNCPGDFTGKNPIQDGWWSTGGSDSDEVFSAEYVFNSNREGGGEGGGIGGNSWYRGWGTGKYYRDYEYYRKGSSESLIYQITVTHDTGFSHRSNLSKPEDMPLEETFSGTLPGGITYTGQSTVTPEGAGVSNWDTLTQETEFLLNGTFYADTTIEIAPEFENDKFGIDRLINILETTDTTYVDGSRRESRITTSYTWDSGDLELRSGSGTVEGSGECGNYTADVTVVYNDGGYLAASEL